MNFVQRVIYKYELETALYMLEPWEKMLFNTGVMFGMSVAAFCTYAYFYIW